MAPYKDKAPVLPEPKLGFMVRRTITDLTELSFVGSDVAAVFLLAGAFISWFLNPAHLCSGIPFLFPAILCSQLLTGALCVFFFYDKWVDVYKRQPRATAPRPV